MSGHVYLCVYILDERGNAHEYNLMHWWGRAGKVWLSWGSFLFQMYIGRDGVFHALDQSTTYYTVVILRLGRRVTLGLLSLAGGVLIRQA